MTAAKVDVLIAAYNEQKTIGGVIDVLLQTRFVNQIIVIDDGSTDSTYRVASRYGKKITLLKMPKNSGKSEAISFGLSRVSTPFVFLCDADLVKISPTICESIIDPVVRGQVDMSIGQRRYHPFVNILNRYTAISGERALTTNILNQCARSKFFYNYGMETVINLYCYTHHLRIKSQVYDYSHTTHLTAKNPLKGIWIYTKQVLLIIKIYLAITIRGWH